MNDISTDELLSEKQQLDSSTCDKDEVDKLASELADNYVGYLNIDLKDHQQRLEDFTEECLTHLEEVCSVLDSCRQNSADLGSYVEKLTSKNDLLEKLYEQVDAIEQYIFETTRLLDELELLMEDLKHYKKFTGGNKIRQIIESLPKISLNKLPRFGLLTSLGSSLGVVDEPGNSSIDGEQAHSKDQPTVSLEEVLRKVSKIESSLNIATLNLHRTRE